jgi:hypothetical protein
MKHYILITILLSLCSFTPYTIPDVDHINDQGEWNSFLVEIEDEYQDFCKSYPPKNLVQSFPKKKRERKLIDFVESREQRQEEGLIVIRHLLKEFIGVPDSDCPNGIFLDDDLIATLPGELSERIAALEWIWTFLAMNPVHLELSVFKAAELQLSVPKQIARIREGFMEIGMFEKYALSEKAIRQSMYEYTIKGALAQRKGYGWEALAAIAHDIDQRACIEDIGYDAYLDQVAEELLYTNLRYFWELATHQRAPANELEEKSLPILEENISLLECTWYKKGKQARIFYLQELIS